MENIKKELEELESRLSEIIKELYELDKALIKTDEINAKKAAYEKQLNEISEKKYNLKSILEIPVINKINSISDDEIIKLCDERKQIINEKVSKIKESKDAISLKREDLDISLSYAISNWDKNSYSPSIFYKGISTYLNKESIDYIRATFFDKLSPEMKQGLEYLALIKNDIDNQISLMKASNLPVKEEDIINAVMDKADSIHGTNRNFVKKFNETFENRNSLGFGLSCILHYQRLTKIAESLNIDLSQMPNVDLNDMNNYKENNVIDRYNERLRNLINEVYKEKNQQYNTFELEEKTLNQQIAQLDEWSKNPNVFRNKLKEKFNVSGYERSSEFKELKAVSQADQELTDLSAKAGTDIKNMNSVDFTALLDAVKVVDRINNEIAKLSKDDSDINVITQRLNGLVTAGTFAPYNKSVDDLNNKLADQEAIITSSSQSNLELQKEKEELENKKLVLNKTKKISEIDAKIAENNSKIAAVNNVKNGIINEISSMKNRMITQIIDVIRNECRISTIVGQDLEKYLKMIAYTASVDTLIDSINTKLFMEQNNIKAEIRSRQEQINAMKETTANLTPADAHKIEQNKTLLATSNQANMINYYNQVNGNNAVIDELPHLEENVDQMLEDMGRKL